MQTTDSVISIAIEVPISLNVGTNSNDNIILMNIPYNAACRICLSFPSALNTWNPKIVDKLTINMSGVVI